jgi:deoxyribonuclease II
MNLRHLLLTLLPIIYSQCIGDDGKQVDSWFAIKYPRGTDYVYYDEQKGTLTRSLHSVNDTQNGALAYTMRQLWDGWNYLIYNDEVANQPYDFKVGHAKGVWGWKEDSGFLLQHSIPLFPTGPTSVSSYSGLGKNAWEYGQHLACFSFSLEQLNTAATIAPLMALNIYDTSVDSATPSSLAALAQGLRNTSAVCEDLKLQTQAGLGVRMFAKSAAWNNELYDACIAPQLGVDLAVESWIRGSACGPYCSSPRVYDIQELELDGTSFSEYNDHSKWAIQWNSSGAWVCPSGINRMTTQAVRGGGAFCFNDKVLHSALTAAVVKTNMC